MFLFLQTNKIVPSEPLLGSADQEEVELIRKEVGVAYSMDSLIGGSTRSSMISSSGSAGMATFSRTPPLVS